jgi:hypothetical protein
LSLATKKGGHGTWLGIDRSFRARSPIVKLIAVASIALAVMAGVMASGRAHDTCAIGPDSGPGSEIRSLDLGGCARPPATLAGSTHP